MQALLHSTYKGILKKTKTAQKYFAMLTYQIKNTKVAAF